MKIQVVGLRFNSADECATALFEAHLKIGFIKGEIELPSELRYCGNQTVISEYIKRALKSELIY